MNQLFSTFKQQHFGLSTLFLIAKQEMKMRIINSDVSITSTWEKRKKKTQLN